MSRFISATGSTVDQQPSRQRNLRVTGRTICWLATATLIGLSISVPIEMLIFHAEAGVEVTRLRGLEVEHAVAEIRHDPADNPQTTPEAARLTGAMASSGQDLRTSSQALASVESAAAAAQVRFDATARALKNAQTAGAQHVRHG